jgi:hypothetical protein
MLARPWAAWLDTVWNAVDKDRVKQVGGATVAAQWMLRLGGSVQLGDKRWITDYNSLPASPSIQVSAEFCWWGFLWGFFVFVFLYTSAPFSGFGA